MSDEEIVGAAQNEVSTAATETAAEISSAVQAGYDRIANPDKVEAKETQPTVETPPEPAMTGEQAKELMAQVARIPDLEKQLRDTGGRYGALKQTIEQLQQRITASTTAREQAETSADAGELLADLREEFPELADKLEGAFSKVMASKSGAIDPGSIEKIVAERIEGGRKAAVEEAMERLSESHPDWLQVRETPEFKEWKESLPPRILTRFTRSQDPDYVAEMLDQHKDWLKSRNTIEPPPPKQEQTSTAQANKSRLKNAVLPTNGTSQAIKGEPDPKASIRIGYERIAGKRI